MKIEISHCSVAVLQSFQFDRFRILLADVRLWSSCYRFALLNQSTFSFSSYAERINLLRAFLVKLDPNINAMSESSIFE